MEERSLVSKIRENFSFFGGMSLLYGMLFTFCMYQNPNGITFPILVAITILFAVKYVKKIGLQIQKDTWIYAIGMLLLGISSFMTSNVFLIFFNLLGILLLFFIMMIHQFYRDKDWNFQTYLKNLFCVLGTTIPSIRYPFLHTFENFVGKSETKKKTATYIFSGIAIAFVLLIVIFPLLISSDRIFEMYFGKFVSHIRLGNIFWIFIMTITMTITMTILCYAFFSSLCEMNMEVNTEKKMNDCNPIVGITFTSVLAFIYLIYSGIQILYLFIGIENGLPEGITYSSYARTGFWELLFVSIINFGIVLICVYLFTENKILKIILTIISMCTFVMIFSAAYRMCMYVEVYHLTFLRILVLWFLFLLTLIMAGTVLSIYRKQFSLFRYITLVTACCYIVFSLARLDYWIAKYNVEHMQEIGWEDLNHLLYGLSDDAAPVITEINWNQILEYGYNDGTQGTIEEYFQGIKNKYGDEEIRKFNYSHIQALKAAEKYFNNNL